MTAAERLAHFVADLDYDALPAPVVEQAKLHLLDTVGCGLAASALDVAVEARAVAAELGSGGDAVVIGSLDTFPAASAALANGALCHGLDFDDTHGASICHVSAGGAHGRAGGCLGARAGRRAIWRVTHTSAVSRQRAKCGGTRRMNDVELVIRDLKDQALAHFPSGQFHANSAWTVIAALTHNLLRWTELLGLPGRTIRAARTLRRRLLTLPGRLTSHAGRWTLHLPARWPWQQDFSEALTRIRALPAPG